VERDNGSADERPAERPGIRVACCVSRLEHHGSHSCPPSNGTATWWHTLSLSLSPSLSLSLSLALSLSRSLALSRSTGCSPSAGSASGDTLKSHEICIPAPSPSRSLHTNGREYSPPTSAGRQKAYPLVLQAVPLSLSLSLSPSLCLVSPRDAGERGESTSAFRFCEIFRRFLPRRASANEGEESCVGSSAERRSADVSCSRFVSDFGVVTIDAASDFSVESRRSSDIVES
jgi:hypothetical protein